MNWTEIRANTLRGVWGFYGLIQWRLTISVSECQLDSWSFLYPIILQKFVFVNMSAELVFSMDSDRITRTVAHSDQTAQWQS